MSVFDKSSEILIPEDDPFKNDLFNREELINPLTRLITSMEKPFVLSVEAPWGHGKTTFVRMWKQYLKDQGKVALHFNAWENDYTDDPLASLIISLSNQIDSDYKNLKLSNKTEKLLDIGGKLAKIIFPILLGVATRGVINQKTIESAKSEMQPSDYQKLVTETSKGLVSLIKEQTKTIISFKRSLSEITAELEKQEKLPMVIFIDELDRCRPDFALSLLERIKHLFDIEHIVFILSIDRSQLEESIKAIYGNGLDAQQYLRRFIDQSFMLTFNQNKNYPFINFLFRSTNLDDFLNHTYRNEEGHKRLILAFSNEFPLSLREIEQAIYSLNIILRTLPKNYLAQFNSVLDLTVLLLMKIVNRDLFSKIEYGSLTALYDYEEKMSGVRRMEPLLIDWGYLFALLVPTDKLDIVQKDLEDLTGKLEQSNPNNSYIFEKLTEVKNSAMVKSDHRREFKEKMASINLANMFFTG